MLTPPRETPAELALIAQMASQMSDSLRQPVHTYRNPSTGQTVVLPASVAPPANWEQSAEVGPSEVRPIPAQEPFLLTLLDAPATLDRFAPPGAEPSLEPMQDVSELIDALRDLIDAEHEAYHDD